MEPRDVRLNDGGSLLIREASSADAAALLVHVEAVSGESDFLTMGPGDFELTVEQEEEFLATSRASPTSLYAVAVMDGAIVGSTFVASGKRPRIRHVAELGLSVRRSHWGRGVGSVLLDTQIAWTCANPILTKLDLRVRADNARAIALYQRNGFEIEGRLRNQLVVDGVAYDHLWMGRDV